MTDYAYNFPATRFVPSDQVTRLKQLHKVEEELEEATVALHQEDFEEYIEELLDCAHAIETALMEFDDERVAKAVDKVVKKNEAKGHYPREPKAYLTVGELLPPIECALCYSEEDAADQLMRFGLSAGEVPAGSRTAGEAVTAYLDGKFVAVVRVDDSDGNRESQLGVVAHETVHVVTRYLESLGCESVDDEIRAYITQSVGQALLETFLKHMERKDEDAS